MQLRTNIEVVEVQKKTGRAIREASMTITPIAKDSADIFGYTTAFDEAIQKIGQAVVLYNLLKQC